MAVVAGRTVLHRMMVMTMMRMGREDRWKKEDDKGEEDEYDGDDEEGEDDVKGEGKRENRKM